MSVSACSQGKSSHAKLKFETIIDTAYKKCDLHLVIKYQNDLLQCQHESEDNDDNTEAVEDEGYG